MSSLVKRDERTQAAKSVIGLSLAFAAESVKLATASAKLRALKPLGPKATDDRFDAHFADLDMLTDRVMSVNSKMWAIRLIVINKSLGHMAQETLALTDPQALCNEPIALALPGTLDLVKDTVVDSLADLSDAGYDWACHVLGLDPAE